MGRIIAALTDPVLREWLDRGYAIVTTDCERAGVVRCPGGALCAAIPESSAADARPIALRAAILDALREHLGPVAFGELLGNLANARSATGAATPIVPPRPGDPGSPSATGSPPGEGPT